MMKSKPLRRPGTRRCAECHGNWPLGHYTSHVVLDSQPGRWKRIEHDVCKGCRSGSRGMPGRAFR